MPAVHRAVLFTAFEPSGDAHAAPVIRALLAAAPDVKVYAWGGPLMAEAGAILVETTASDGAMGLNAFGRVAAVRREIGRIKRWSAGYRVLVHVPVDSPAANFPICRIMRRAGARIVHLVAPQLWAWAPWRARKLRRLTDLVLCLLPFEEAWFAARGVPARFIGHPRVNRTLPEDAMRERAKRLPAGGPRLGIFPGSRSHEVEANIGLLVTTYAELQSRHSGLAGVIVAANDELARIVRRRIAVFPGGLHMIVGDADAAIAWCDLAIAVSGTITLDIARQRKPMIGVYRTGLFTYLLSKIILTTPLRLLPNLVAEREIVPEFVPHIGGAMAIVRAATPILLDSKKAAILSEELARACARFAGRKPAEEAARAILAILDGK